MTFYFPFLVGVSLMGRPSCGTASRVTKWTVFFLRRIDRSSPAVSPEREGSIYFFPLAINRGRPPTMMLTHSLCRKFGKFQAFPSDIEGGLRRGLTSSSPITVLTSTSATGIFLRDRGVPLLRDRGFLTGFLSPYSCLLDF